MAIFLTVVLSIWALMHGFVFWRLASVPWVASCLSKRALVLTAVALWASFPLARILDSWQLKALAGPLEHLASNWVGVLFLLVAALLAVEVVTFGGWLFSHSAPLIRGWSAVAALVLAGIALVQGMRPPVIREVELRLAKLPIEAEGTVLVQISDLHLGAMVGRSWLERLVARVDALRPDIVVIVGDIVDGNVERVQPLLPSLRKLQAPLGVWTVTGNHEYYAGVAASVRLLEEAGFRVLRDSSAELKPGLVVAGVDDLTAREQFRLDDDPLGKALKDRPPGATVFLSHTPWQAERAAALGADLMLCGHTHNGQIWPFNYLVRTRYPLITGRYSVNGMEVLVGCGTGTWGPRMRLWKPAEILRITLRKQ